MKSVVAVVLALCVAFVASQSASTNPTGAVYFFPSTELKLNSTVTSTLFNTTGNYYADFYRVWVPSDVQSVEYIVTNNQTDYYTSYVDFYINFVVSGQDSTFGYSCSGNNGNEFNSPCDYADDYFYTSSGSGVNSEIYYAGQDYAPGRWQYITIVKENYNTGNYTVYTLTAKANTYCSSNTSVVVLDYSATTCAVSTSVNNITASGQTVTAQSVSGEGDFDAFLVQVPQNVTRVWGFVSADDDNLYFLAAANYIPIYSGYSTTYTTYGYYNSTTSKYNFFLQYDLPNNNQPLYFAVTPYYSTGTVNYDIQFFWTACDAAHAGFGNLYVDVYEMTTSYEDQPDCQYPIVFNNVNLLTSLTTTTWTVAPYNSTTDSSVGYHASYAVVNVPAATVGSLNFTCNATNTAFVAFSLNQMTVCDDYLFRLDCVGGSYATGDLQTLLSHDLYPGGWWSVAACNPNSGNSVTVSLVASGSVSAAPSASPSSGSDEGASSTVVPALLFTVLAAVLAF